MEELQDFCKKHSIEMTHDKDLGGFTFIRKRQRVTYNFYRSNDLRGMKELQETEHNFSPLILHLKRNFKIRD